MIASLGTSTASQTGTLSVVTADASGTLGLSTGFASSAVVAANTAQINSNRGLINANSGAISALQGQTAALFDLTEVNRVDIRKANEGVAIALAMESPVLLPGNTFGVAGGFGYFQERVGGSASFAARIGDNAAFTGGLGIGFDSGEVGARAGFQFAW